MAGEKKGKAYEALVHVALQELVDEKKLTGPLHWNITPKGMSIEPDFMTGIDPNDPKTILLLNHSNAAGNSHMKFWRNLGELVEAKTVLPSMPRVYCLTFGVIKTDLEPIQQHAFDQFVWVRQATQSWADDLDAFITSRVPTFPKGKDTQTDFMRAELKTASVETKAAYHQLKLLLETIHKAESATLDKMWADHRARSIPAAPGARRTFVRRGLSKLSLFDDISVAIRLNAGELINEEAFGEYLYKLGFVSRFGGYAKLQDMEISSAIKLIGQDASTILEEAPLDAMSRWIIPLRMLGAYDDMYAYVMENFDKFKEPSALLETLCQVYIDPASFIQNNSISYNWLYFYLIDILKAGQGKAQGIGYAQILSLAKKHKKKIDIFLSAEGLPPVELRGQSFLVRGLTDWVSRLDTPQAHGFSRSFQGITAYVLSDQLKQLKRIPTQAEIEEMIIKSNLEQKLVTYRDFNPINTLLRINNIVGKQKKILACFAEKATCGALGGGTGVMTLNHTLVNWQSCSDAGRDHKKKELCGRAIGLRYHWDGKSFVRRPGINKMILVLDGTWRQADLNALLRAGWDEIYYPDEMDQLAKAIV